LLIAGGKKEKQVYLTVAVLTGIHKDPFLASVPLFEKKHPDVTINIVEYPLSDIYEKLMIEATSHSGAIDVYELANGWVPEFAENGFILPLDDYFMEKDPWLDDIFPTFDRMMKYAGKYYCLILDGVVFMSYYRKDLFEDSQEKATFKRKYGYELKIPDTWDQWADMAEFFTRDTDGNGEIDLWGNIFMLQRLMAPFTFLQFFHSYGGTYFDPITMKPLINSQQGVQASHMLARLLPYGPSDMINWGYAEVRDAFKSGDAAMMIQWNEMTWEISADSKVKGKILYGPMPGVMIGGKINKPALQAWGWSASISSDTKNPNVAYDYLHFISSPEISLEIFAIPFDGFEPWRESHFSDTAMPKWIELSPHAPFWLASLKESLKNGIPDLQIPGMFEYYDSLGIQMEEVVIGNKSINEALNDAVADWTKITEQRGLDQQRVAYQELFK
jgi:multiple sugar transport system substrate-binding protein